MKFNSSRLDPVQVTQRSLYLRNVIQHYVQAPSVLVATIGFLALGIIVVLRWPGTRKKAPLSLPDPIPFVFNTLQFIFNNEQFLNRVSKALEHTNLVKFYLLQKPVFLVAGQQNIQAIFSRSHKVGTETIYVQNVLPNLYGMSKEDVQRFAEDKSGRDRVPAPGYENVPPGGRLWFGYEHVHSEYLSKTQHFRPVAEYFSKRMLCKLDEAYAAGEWSSISLLEFCRHQVAERAIEAIFGPKLLELNPGLLNAFWEFDSNIIVLTLGLPKWLMKRSYRAQERFYAMIRMYLDTPGSMMEVDSTSEGAGSTRHPGSLVCREIVNWCRESSLDGRAEVGAMAMLMFALISNTVPTTSWVILEIVKDPALLEAVREEVENTLTTNSVTGEQTLTVSRVSTLPLLQSIFTEVLRLHINFNLIRNVNEPITVDGVTLRPGSMLQAPMRVPHYDETTWGREGHPAAEFWAERHVTWRQTNDETGGTTHKRAFAMAGRPSSYFPFGGGHQICPGRHLARQEILTTVALLILKFDIELVGWTKLDGSPSERPAQGDRRFSGAGAMPPDRDLKLRWKRNERNLIISNE